MSTPSSTMTGCAGRIDGRRGVGRRVVSPGVPEVSCVGSYRRAAWCRRVAWCPQAVWCLKVASLGRRCGLDAARSGLQEVDIAAQVVLARDRTETRLGPPPLPVPSTLPGFRPAGIGSPPARGSPALRGSPFSMCSSLTVETQPSLRSPMPWCTPPLPALVLPLISRNTVVSPLLLPDSTRMPGTHAGLRGADRVVPRS